MDIGQFIHIKWCIWAGWRLNEFHCCCQNGQTIMCRWNKLIVLFVQSFSFNSSWLQVDHSEIYKKSICCLNQRNIQNIPHFVTKNHQITQEMQPLPTTHRVLIWLSMCPADEFATCTQKVLYLANTLFVLIVNTSSFFACLRYCIKNTSIDFDSSTFAFMVAIGEFGLIYSMIALIQMRHRIDDTFTSLTTIYNCSRLN